MVAAADWLWARIPTRFPEIRIAFSEGGIGWVPMLIDRIDYVLDHSAVGSNGWDDPNLAPTDAMRRNFWFCTIDIPSTMSLRDHIGIDHICMESDYPHADSTWPDTQLRARRRARATSRPTTCARSRGRTRRSCSVIRYPPSCNCHDAGRGA